LRFRRLVGAVSDRIEGAGGGASVEETSVIPIGRRSDMRWIAAAASVLVLLGVSLWYFTGQDTDYRALALAELERPLSNVRSGAVITDQVDSLHQEATKRLLGGQHEDFLRFSARLMEDSLFAVRHGERSRLDRAYALLKLERPAEARAELAGVETTDKTITAERAYYLSLAHLMEENPDAARSALDSVDAPFPWDERVARLREGMGL